MTPYFYGLRLRFSGGGVWGDGVFWGVWGGVFHIKIDPRCNLKVLHIVEKLTGEHEKNARIIKNNACVFRENRVN